MFPNGLYLIQENNVLEFYQNLTVFLFLLFFPESSHFYIYMLKMSYIDNFQKLSIKNSENPTYENCHKSVL